MAAYDNKVLTGDQLTYLVQLIKTADAAKANAADIPTALDDLTGDATHRLVTDTEKTTWNGKQDALVFNTTYDATNNKVATVSDIPTNTNQLTNGAGFQTSSDVQSAITTAIGGISTFGFEIVQSLPVSNIATNKIYLLAKASAGTNNVYTEYAYINNSWEILGDTQVTIDTLTNTEVQTIWDNASAS